MRIILYVCALLLAPSALLANPPQAPVPLQGPPILAQAPPIKQAEPDCHDHGWTDAGGGYQRHTSGYLYHPAHGVYWPQPVQAAPMMYQPSFGFRGGFAGNCVGGT